MKENTTIVFEYEDRATSISGPITVKSTNVSPTSTKVSSSIVRTTIPSALETTLLLSVTKSSTIRDYYEDNTSTEALLTTAFFSIVANATIGVDYEDYATAVTNTINSTAASAKSTTVSSCFVTATIPEDISIATTASLSFDDHRIFKQHCYLIL